MRNKVVNYLLVGIVFVSFVCGQSSGEELISSGDSFGLFEVSVFNQPGSSLFFVLGVIIIFFIIVFLRKFRRGREHLQKEVKDGE